MHNDDTVIAPVPILLCVRAPIAIVFFVIPVVVSALKCVPGGWPQPHVFNEIFEFQPSLAHCDAARSVSVVPLIFRIEATIFHMRPSTRFGRGPGTLAKTMRGPRRIADFK